MGNSQKNQQQQINSMVHQDSLRTPVSDLIQTSTLKKQYSNLPSKEDFPDKQYALMVQSRPQFPHPVKITISNIRNNHTMDSETPIFFIRQKNVYYQGNWRKGLPHGQGNIYFQQGHYFRGIFQNGQAICQNGILVYPNGALYEGAIYNSALNGFGKLTYPDQVMIYKGHWQNNLPHGLGQQIFNDGSKYQGHFFHGAKQGSGKYTFQNNTRQYNGTFVNGVPQGSGILKDSLNKSQYKGQFKDGMKNGHGKLYTQFGQLEGYFVNDYIAGRGLFKWSDGRTYLGQFKQNKMHGNGKIVYPNSQVIQGIWQNGINTSIGNVHDHKIPLMWSYMDPVQRVQYDGKLSQIIITSKLEKLSVR